MPISRYSQASATNRARWTLCSPASLRGWKACAALRHRVLLSRASNGIPLDISLGALEFENVAVERSLLVEIADGAGLRLCSPDALILFRVFAGRAQDRLDVEGVVAKSGQRIDWTRVRADLRMLLDLKEDAESLPRLEMILARRGIGTV